MMYIIKKCSISVLALIIILAIVPITTYAVEGGDEYYQGKSAGEYNSVTISERDMIHDLQQLSDEELKKLGYTDNEISELRQVNDEYVVKVMRAKTDEELLSMGLTPRQIDIIRNSGNITLAASESFGKVTYTIQKISYTYKSSNTKLQLRATWQWSSSPVFVMTDTFACTTSDSKFTKESASCVANYRLSKGGTILKRTNPSVKTKSSGRGTYVEIPMAYLHSDGIRKMKAFDGILNVTFKATGEKISSVGASSKYIHSKVGVTPSVSFRSGDIGFSPTIGYDSGPEAYIRLEL